MPKNVVCKKCNNLVNDWCEKVIDSPDPDMQRDCQHFCEKTSGVTVQEWVSVNDRLPEESGMYIITANDGHAQRVSFVQWQKKNRMWNLTGARSYWRVTHWMPMPLAPEVKND